jgi:hypothetical protein
MLAHGQGGPQVLPLARHYYQRAADQGHALSLHELKNLVYFGPGGSQDALGAFEAPRSNDEIEVALELARMGDRSQDDR